MFKAILQWLGPHILRLIIPVLDPEASNRAKKLLADSEQLDKDEKAMAERRAAFEARRVESERENARLQQETVELDNRIAELGKKFAADTKVREGMEDDLQKKLKIIDDRPDTDRIEQPLPGTGTR